MNWSIILFSTSITISSIIFFLNYKAIKKYNNLIAGQQALQIRSGISSARRRMEELSLQYAPNNSEIIEATFHSIKEDLCNVYDQACTLYNLDQLDKVGFKKQYFDEIKNIVEDDNFKDKYEPSTTVYPDTRKVYDEWFHQK